jgi:hypothetical protein
MFLKLELGKNDFNKVNVWGLPVKRIILHPDENQLPSDLYPGFNFSDILQPAGSA